MITCSYFFVASIGCWIIHFTFMKVVHSSTIDASLARIVFCYQSKDEVVSGVNTKEFDGSTNSTLLLRENGVPVLYVGLGKSEGINERVLRRAIGTAVRSLKAIGITKAQLEVEACADSIAALTDAALVGSYDFDIYKTEDNRKDAFKKLVLVAPESMQKAVEQGIAEGSIYGEVVNRVRAIGNEPGNVCNPKYLAEKAEELAKQCDLKCKIFKKKDLEEGGFGGILAVGEGSVNTPRMIVLEHKVSKDAPTIAIVGKAITFDSGGISIKPSASMEEMKWDKMGGVGTLGIMEAVSRLNIPVNVTGIICSAENMPSGTAFRPGDIVKTYSGKTVEILNTDAEGRMVLSDGLAYAVEKYNPAVVMDMATLTGACCVALGLRRTGIFSTCTKASHQLHAIGERTDDRCWSLPMGDEYSDMMKGDVTDLKNAGSSRYGGASSAASFLNEFVGETPHVHVDIAGTGWLVSKESHLALGATGAGVRLVTEFIRNFE